MNKDRTQMYSYGIKIWSIFPTAAQIFQLTYCYFLYLTASL